ncbi:cobalamin-binding protein [Mesobacillus zeae]|uniref:Cobalamin-binding protein n=1 Tax=Mesobacillus zeae TaxID=1917180 RepID=A0A398BNC9_9BACI|nr:cobalamin-binding protein [Mesobacillus zeae]RID88863.1 cobalamin-binding protein [Mesobacillus zeae]
MKIISICPSNTELIEYLGLSDKLIAVDDFSDWPDSIKSLPRLGPDLSINLDLVDELKPDLVLASLSVPGMEKNVEGLKQRGIPYIVLNPQSLHDIENDLVRTGEALQDPERGKEAAARYREKLEHLRTQGKEQMIGQRPSLYWEWWPKPVFTPGRINWLTEISEAAGARNLYDDVELASIQTSWEDVLKRNPDYICVAWVGVRKQKIRTAQITKRPGWQALEAVQKERIFILEEELYCRPSPRLLDGLEKLLNLLNENH